MRIFTYIVEQDRNRIDQKYLFSNIMIAFTIQITNKKKKISVTEADWSCCFLQLTIIFLLGIVDK